jgi:hypothetical protein
MTRPSLLHLFEAPIGYEGAFGWICGFSADALFLDGAAERFTRRGANQRARDGRIALALMLDPCHEPLSFLDVPAVVDLPILDFDRRPFRLLHAKVALLGFRSLETAGWRIRLLVSTGNWTQQTVEDSLDLAWTVEIDAAELTARTDDGAADLALRCADVRAAAGLLKWLGALFDTRLLQARGASSAGPAPAREQLDRWVKACVPAAGTRARLFDNRDSALLAQLAPLIEQHAQPGARNFLALGSGFYEAPAPGGAVPGVLTRIVETLRQGRLLTQSPTVHLYVNEDACQAVATSFHALENQGWQVFAPSRPAAIYGTDSRRTLHAKFLFSGWWRERSCSRIWIYLGSGNLTGPGFCSRMARGAGNLEAGVVFGLNSLPWETDVNGEASITSLLPLHFNGAPLSAEAPPAAGGTMPERPPPFVAVPVAWVHWHDAEDGGTLVLPSGIAAEGLELLAADGQPCPRSDRAWRWLGKMPRQVIVSWGAGERAVPVVDAFGRIAAGALPALELEEIGDQLESFPALPPSDEPIDDVEPNVTGTGASTPPLQQDIASTAPATSQLAIRSMMLQLERIAQIQTEVAEQDWEAWCHRLEQTLVQAAGSGTLEQFRALGLDPLSALLDGSFRPVYAADATLRAGRAYEEVLTRVGEAWKVSSLLALRE